MKILLLQPWHADDKSYRARLSGLISYAPLTLATLLALIPQEIEASVDTYDEIQGNYPLKHQKYDIVALSVLTSTAPRAYKIAQHFRQQGSYIVMGGYQPTHMPEEAAQYADTVIVGAAEYSWPQFLKDFAAGCPKPLYDRQHVNGADIVPPDRRAIPRKKYLKYPAVIANRGCPNNCEFCAISKMWRTCSARPVENVINEIKALNTRMLVFFDPNFFGDREYSMALMKQLAKLNIRWVGSATIASAFDQELMRAAQQSGCAGLLVGLESMNRNTLDTSNKGFNDPSNYKQAIAIMQSYGISVNGCFILGMDGDTEQELLSLPEQINYLNLNLARFAILTPVPNSPLFRRLEDEGRIITRDWSKYNQHETVFMPQNMSPQCLDQIYRTVWKQTYSFKNIFKRVKNTPNQSLREKFICLGANLGFKYLGIE